MPDYTIGKFRGGFALVYYDAAAKRYHHTLGTADKGEAERRAPSVYTELTRPGTSVAELWDAYKADLAGRAVVGTMEHTWKAMKGLFGLTWEQVDFARDKINLQGPEIRPPHKGRAIVPMTRTLKVRLLEAQRGALSPYVIEWDGERIGSVKKGLGSTAERAKLQKSRRTCCGIPRHPP